MKRPSPAVPCLSSPWDGTEACHYLCAILLLLLLLLQCPSWLTPWEEEIQLQSILSSLSLLRLPSSDLYYGGLLTNLPTSLLTSFISIIPITKLLSRECSLALPIMSSIPILYQSLTSSTNTCWEPIRFQALCHIVGIEEWVGYFFYLRELTVN